MCLVGTPVLLNPRYASNIQTTSKKAKNYNKKVYLKNVFIKKMFNTVFDLSG